MQIHVAPNANNGKFSIVSREYPRNVSELEKLAAKTLFEKLLLRIDFDAVTHTIRRENPDISIKDCHNATHALAQWLSIAPYATEHAQPLQMIKSVDMAWHALVLNTRMYRQVCDTIGFFVDHDPVEADKPNALKEEYSQFTFWVLRKVFGSKINSMFSDLSQSVTCCLFVNQERGMDGKFIGCVSKK